MTNAQAAPANPALLGVPAFAVGALTLGLSLVGFQGGGTGAVIANSVGLSVVGLLIATIWAAVVGAGMMAAIFGVLTGFFLSFVLLSTALGGGSGSGANITYFLVWTVAAAALTVVTLGLPQVYTALVGLLTLAFALLLIFVWAGGDVWKSVAGYVLIVASLVGVYVFITSARAVVRVA